MQIVSVKRWRVKGGPEFRTHIVGKISQAAANRVAYQAQRDKLEGEAMYDVRYNGREVSRVSR